MSYEWDPNKARRNHEKHGIRFADAVSVFMDEWCLIISDEFINEERFIAIGMDAFGRVLVVVYTYRARNIRLISARPASQYERKQYEG